MLEELTERLIEERVKLSYKKVFSRFEMSFSDRLAEYSNKIYPILKLPKTFLFSDNDQYSLRYQPKIKESTDMPLSFDESANKNVDGYVKLDYLDFYDYLPKEDLSKFMKELKKCARRNKLSHLGAFREQKDFESLNDYGQYYDGNSFANILTVVFSKNNNLRQYCSGLEVSLHNLSTTYLIVKYRVYITKDFNARIQEICHTKYPGYTTVCRDFRTPWYAVKKFGFSFHTGDQVRQKKMYEMISCLKWQILKEIRKTFSVRFWEDNMFPPTFETYSTNISINNENQNRQFWNSILVGSDFDYSPTYYTYVCWGYESGNYEGRRLAAICVKNNPQDDFSLDIFQNLVSDVYGGYLTADTMRLISERNIERCNKTISKAIRKAKTSSVLKARVFVERKLYYEYRFISEFSGKSIDKEDVKVFKNLYDGAESISSVNLVGIPECIKETKAKIDNILKLLNDAAEYRSSKSNITLQRIMMFVTILSLLVALCSIDNGSIKKVLLEKLWDLLNP